MFRPPKIEKIYICLDLLAVREIEKEERIGIKRVEE